MTAVVAAPARSGGLAYMAQSALWFAVMSLLVKLASKTMPTLQIVFARGAVTLIIAALMLVHARRHPFGTRPFLMFVRGLIGSCALVCFYAAVVHLPLAEASVVHQTAPLFTALLAAWLLREPLRPLVLLGIAACFGGVLLIARPTTWTSGDDAAHWLWALVALLGALLSAFAYVTVRKLGRTEHPLVVVFWFPLVTVPLSAPFALPQWVAPDWQGWLLLLGIGVATQTAQLAMTKGLAREPAGRATLVGYLQVAFSAVFGMVLLGDQPDAQSLGGMALILGGLLVGARAGRRRN